MRSKNDLVDSTKVIENIISEMSFYLSRSFSISWDCQCKTIFGVQIDDFFLAGADVGDEVDPPLGPFVSVIIKN